jgi:hypothetical protein
LHGEAAQVENWVRDVGEVQLVVFTKLNLRLFEFDAFRFRTRLLVAIDAVVPKEGAGGLFLRVPFILQHLEHELFALLLCLEVELEVLGPGQEVSPHFESQAAFLSQLNLVL